MESIAVMKVLYTFQRFTQMSYQVSCVWLAERDIVAGEEIRISYGPLSDAEMLQTYGFLEPLGEHSNIHNRAVFLTENVYNAGKVCTHCI